MRLAILTCGLVMTVTAISVGGQTQKPVTATPTAPAKATVTKTTAAPAPRTLDGRPDLQGTWDFAQLTPFEKPDAFKDKDAVTDQEVEEFAQRRIDTGNKDRRDGGAAADVE